MMKISNKDKLQRNCVLAKEINKQPAKLVFLKLIGLVITIMLGMCVAVGTRIYFTMASSVRQANQGRVMADSSFIAQQKPFSVLILGVDQGIEGRHDQGNSDTMILVTLNPKKGVATMTSIPRDLLADIQPSKKFYMFRVNSAYQLGGNRAAVKTVSTLLNVPVNNYMEVNMKALKNLVDALGGVDVKVPFSFTYNTKFVKGMQHLNGNAALDYVRMRKEDPQGDYGRQKRQRQVIEQLIHKGMTLKSLNNYRKILNVFAKYVKTNLTFNDMLSVAFKYRSCSHHIVQDYVHAHDAWIGGAALQVASTSELQRVSDLTRSNLNLKKQKLHNEETRQNKLQKHLKWKKKDPFENYIIYERHSKTKVWTGK